jgi:hypothetical protein
MAVIRLQMRAVEENVVRGLGVEALLYLSVGRQGNME